MEYSSVYNMGEFSHKHTWVYIQELYNQAEAFELAVTDYNSVINVPGPNVVAKVFADVQAMVTAAALVSKLLWPSPPKFDIDCKPLTPEDEAMRLLALDRGEQLRRVLGKDVVKKLQVLYSKKVRNSLEHFDERLDQYLFEMGEGANVVDRNIGPREMIAFNGKEPVYIRHVDQTRSKVIVLKDEADLQDIANSMQLLKSVTSQWLAENFYR